MLKFPCGSCGQSLEVPPAYAGKKVRCPGCSAPQRVPTDLPSTSGGTAQMAGPSVAVVDLSALDAPDAGLKARRLRQVLVGCGSCSKTIKIPETKCGSVYPCPLCGVTLKVDAFDLSKSKGDLIDLSHLELEAADPLMDYGSDGSTMGGSSVGSRSGSGGGSKVGRGPGGDVRSNLATMGGSAEDLNGQAQMRELRDLNDLRHSGAISNDEYKRRKSEIYAGRTLAHQAMSRSANGVDSSRPVLGVHQGGAIPGPVKALIAVGVASAIGVGVWFGVIQPSMQSNSPLPAGPVAVAPPTAPTEPAAPAEAVVAAETAPEGTEPGPMNAEASPLVEAITTTVATTAEGTAPEGTTPADAGTAEAPMTAGQTSPDSKSIFEFDEPTPTPVTPVATADPEAPAATADPAAMTPPVVEAPPVEPAPLPVVTRWPVLWPDYSAPANMAIAKACTLVKMIQSDGAQGYMGVGVGPAAVDYKDPAYITFMDQQRAILLDTAAADGVVGDLIINAESSPTRNGPIFGHRLVATSRTNRDARLTIVTGVQDGHAVSYWFAGSRRVYNKFLEAVGTAELGQPGQAIQPGLPG